MDDKELSGLTARFALGDIDTVQATVTLTASVSFWKEAAKGLDAGTDGYGAWQVKAAIKDIIRQAEQTFYKRVEPAAKKC